MSEELKLKPQFWQEQFGVKIADPDGWRSPGDPSWDTAITQEDFRDRMSISTVAVVDNDLYRKMMRK
jgi:hypothetical protein